MRPRVLDISRRQAALSTGGSRNLLGQFISPVTLVLTTAPVRRKPPIVSTRPLQLRRQTFSTNYTLSYSQQSLHFRQEKPRSGAKCPLAARRQIYFTDYTLTGKPAAYSFWMPDAVRRSHPAERAVSTGGSRATCLPNLFHQLHFD